jgi:hypothetical protein
MSDQQKNTQQLIATWASFVALCSGIAVALVQMGRRDAQLTQTVEQVRELGSIVSELAKAQVAFTLTDKQTEERLRELTLRLDRLERNGK